MSVSTKTPDRNDSKLDMIGVIDTVSKPIDFEFKRSGLGLGLRMGLRLGLEFWGLGLWLGSRRRFASRDSAHIVLFSAGKEQRTLHLA